MLSQRQIATKTNAVTIRPKTVFYRPASNVSLGMQSLHRGASLAMEFKVFDAIKGSLSSTHSSIARYSATRRGISLRKLHSDGRGWPMNTNQTGKFRFGP